MYLARNLQLCRRSYSLNNFVRLFDFVLELTEASLSEAEELAKKVRKTLECAPMDPRYLTEEGFVRALYMV